MSEDMYRGRTDEWILLGDGDERTLVRLSDIKSIDAESLNMDDVNYYVQLLSADETRVVRISHSVYAQLVTKLKIVCHDEFIVHCPACGGVPVMFSQCESSNNVPEQDTQGIYCANNPQEHRVICPLGMRHSRAPIMDAWCAGNFGILDT